MKRRLIVADLKSYNNYGINTGHYFSLARNFQELFRDRCRVVVAGGPIYKTGFKEEELFQLPYDFIAGGKTLKNKWGTFLNCRHLMRNTGENDVILLQFAGVVTNLLAVLLFARKKNNLYFILYDMEALESPLKRFIYRMAKHKIKGITCPADLIGKAYGLPYCKVSDYIYASDDTEVETIPFGEKKYDFAMVGGLSADKGIVEAVERLRGTSYRAIVAGKPANQEIANRLTALAKEASNIELHLGFVSTDDFYTYLRQSKYSLMNYGGVYATRSSGVVLDALFNGTPIVGHKSLAMQFVEDNGVGKLFDDISLFDPNIADDQQCYERYMTAIQKYLEKHKQYKKSLAAFLNL